MMTMRARITAMAVAVVYIHLLDGFCDEEDSSSSSPMSFLSLSVSLTEERLSITEGIVDTFDTFGIKESDDEEKCVRLDDELLIDGSTNNVFDVVLGNTWKMTLLLPG